MKKAILFILVIFTLCCGTVYASNDYSIINMAEFSDVEIFSEGLCAVQDTATQRWGFVDVNKNWVIEPQYKRADYFKNGLCGVQTVNGDYVLINHNNEQVYKASIIGYPSVIKHGQYYIIFDEYVSILDGNYNNILKQDVKINIFRPTIYSPEGSTVFFKDYSTHKVYNYKGVDITDKLNTENVEISNDIMVNDKYIIGFADNKIKCFDVDGNKVAEFENLSGTRLNGDFIINRDNIYNIQLNKKVYSGEDLGENVKVYYNKYFTVTQGTTALYSYSGDVLVDFGKWDYLYPSAMSNYIVVLNSSKYGVADYAGNIVIPLEYSFAHNSIVDETGQYALLKQGNTSYCYINLSTLAINYQSEGWNAIGTKYIIRGNTIMDKNFNVLYTVSDNYKFRDRLHLDNGVVKLYRSNGNKTEYAFLLFNDKGGVKVQLNGKNITFDELPTIQNGRTLVPMRAIFEALGASVIWNGETQSITAQKGSTVIQMQIGSNTIIKDGQNITMDVAPSIIGGRTMVPVRAISDCFNIGVDWNGYTQTVSLFTN